ncbi:hypothetical protein MC885_020934 [Smutsia gigantea]|nr:hypothetical protein MC885_020934 [Smutsia gigantea]
MGFRETLADESDQTRICDYKSLGPSPFQIPCEKQKAAKCQQLGERNASQDAMTAALWSTCALVLCEGGHALCPRPPVWRISCVHVISIGKNREDFHLTYDSKSRFAAHHSTPEEAKYKLCKVRKISVGTRGTPHLVTHGAHPKHYTDPFTKENDTIQTGLETSEITSVIKFDPGNQRYFPHNAVCSTVHLNALRILPVETNKDYVLSVRSSFQGLQRTIRKHLSYHRHQVTASLRTGTAFLRV